MGLNTIWTQVVDAIEAFGHSNTLLSLATSTVDFLGHRRLTVVDIQHIIYGEIRKQTTHSIVIEISLCPTNGTHDFIGGGILLFQARLAE